MSEEKASSINWRDSAIGAGTSLVVTTLGGIVLWYVTREPPARELLTYRVDSRAEFVSNGNTVTFLTLKIANEGTSSAKSVNISGEIGGAAKIRDLTFRFSSGPAPAFQNYSNNSKINVSIPKLLPQENVIISALVLGRVGRSFPLAVRSDEQVGSLVPDQVADKSKIFSLKEVIFVVIMMLISQMILSAGIKKIRKGRVPKNVVRYHPSHNNAAFILLHSGQYDLAIKSFEYAIQLGGVEDITFSNQAVALAMIGRVDEAYQMMHGISWISTDTHSVAVMQFNFSLIEFLSGDDVHGKSLLESALLKSDDIKIYAVNSVVVWEISQKSKALADILSAKGLKSVGMPKLYRSKAIDLKDRAAGVA